MLILVVLFFALVVVAWWLYKKSVSYDSSVIIEGLNQEPMAIQPQVPNLRAEVSDPVKFKNVFDSWGLGEQTEWQVPGGPLLMGKVSQVEVLVTTEPLL